MGFKKFIKKYWWIFLIIIIVIVIVALVYPSLQQTVFDTAGGASSGMGQGGGI